MHGHVHHVWCGAVRMGVVSVVVVVAVAARGWRDGEVRTRSRWNMRLLGRFQRYLVLAFHVDRAHLFIV